MHLPLDLLTGREGTVDKDTGLIVRDVGRLVGEAGLLAVPADDILFLAEVAEVAEVVEVADDVE